MDEVLFDHFKQLSDLVEQIEGLAIAMSESPETEIRDRIGWLLNDARQYRDEAKESYAEF